MPNGDPYGDEAWYYYISKTLYWNWDPHLSLLPPIRFSFMLLVHQFTKSLTVFRISHIIIFSLVYASILISFIFFKLVDGGNNNSKSKRVLVVPILSVSITLTLYALNPIVVFYTTHVFTTVLGGAISFIGFAISLDNVLLGYPALDGRVRVSSYLTCMK